MNIKSASFITSPSDLGTACPVFKKEFSTAGEVKKAELCITALGLYEAEINGMRVGDFVLAPGWTSYRKRLQYQTYDVTTMLKKDNCIQVTAGNGWCVGRLTWEDKRHFFADTVAIIAALEICYTDGQVETFVTDNSWLCTQSPILMSEIYNGETYDARHIPCDWKPVKLYESNKDVLIPQEGEYIKEIETLKPVSLIHAPNGETLIDFGQNMTGYVEFRVKGNPGEIAEISHAEVLDKEGNFYTENLRDAKQTVTYICDGTTQTFKPHFTFQGFRYVRVNQWPEEIQLENFTAIVVHSDMKRTGHFECSNAKVNRLYQNVVWGQKGNFVDVPTDCPQRDERLGWLGDAQVFCQTAAYNFDVEKFFRKWLHDLAADQYEDGGLPAVIPCVLPRDNGADSAAWGDAATVCPWQIYVAYGDKQVLADQFDSMKAWVEHIRAQGDNEYLWNTGEHYGDWLGMDAPAGSVKGSTSEHLIATAFYAYSTSLLIKAGKVLGKDMSEYESLYQGIRKAFQETYIKDGTFITNTQTAHIVALYFDLVDDKPYYAKRLADMIKANGNRLCTGFVGTAYLMLTLSQNGYHDLAYTLLLQEEFPSWLFSVNMGATTIWEHWDGIRADGSWWTPGPGLDDFTQMNSFNHYSYGAVAAWMYGVMAGINPDEAQPGYRHILLKPVTDERIDYVKASVDTRHGTVASSWERKDGKVTYHFEVPEKATATISIGSFTEEVGPGTYTYTF